MKDKNFKKGAIAGMAGALAVIIAVPTMVGAASEEAVSSVNFERADFERGDHFHRPMHGKFMFGPEFSNEIQRTVKKLDNGLEVTMTTDNEEILAKLKEKSPEDGKGRLEKNNVTVEVELLANGVKIIKTSDDQQTVAKLHEQADMETLISSIKHEVVEVENGVQINITSDNPEAVTKIKERAGSGFGKKLNFGTTE